ncbi:hypothetical protein RABR111495_23095 [Rahnella bruchi]|jgi:hypothetical protein|nr:hypothetical protein EC840_106147 [Rahnella sp. JUb53]
MSRFNDCATWESVLLRDNMNTTIQQLNRDLV